MIYDFDPDAAPDTAFVAGELGHLVVGNRGRLLDARRTPVTIAAVSAERGAFELEIGAFEDAGARWELALEEIDHLQFAPESARAAPEVSAELQRALARFARDIGIPCDAAARERTLSLVAGRRTAARERLGGRDDVLVPGLSALVDRRHGEPALSALVERFLAQQGVAELDRRFAETFVSNPRSGELVKGHAIVLAELGLCPYHGRAVRDPHLFDEPWTRTRRAEHIVARLALIRELWNGWGHEAVTLYRGAAVDGPLPLRSPASFVSATFSSDVAAAHFEGGPATTTAVLWRQRVPVGRLFMTFVETPAMNARFAEAEAILIGEPANTAF